MPFYLGHHSESTAAFLGDNSRRQCRRMDGNNDYKRERENIEEYLKMFCIEELLDETLNVVIEQRPLNPCLEIAKYIQSKAMPEVVSVGISTVLVGGSSYGVDVAVTTNMGIFRGSSAYPSSVGGDSSVFIRDFANLEAEITSAVKKLDPKDMSRVDDVLSGIIKDDPALLLALSIAFCRTAAAFKSLSLHKYISERAEADMSIPLPTPTALVRLASSGGVPLGQQLYLIPTDSTDLQLTIGLLMEASQSIAAVLKESVTPLSLSGSGGPWAVDPLEKAIKVQHMSFIIHTLS